MNEAKKLSPTEVILETSNDQDGKFVIFQLLLKLPKKPSHTAHEIFEILNDQDGKFVIFQLLLKL